MFQDRGYTKYIQAPDVSWNKPFKASCTEKYDKWLGTVGIHEEIAAGNLKAPEKNYFAMDSGSLGRVTHRYYQEIFTCSALNPLADAPKGDSIHCFKEGQPCSTGRGMLRSQLDILNEPETNPFECDESTPSDVEEAYPTMQLLDKDHEGDSDIEIL